MARTAQADVVLYSDLGTRTVFNGNNQTTNYKGHPSAAQFTATASGQLTEIDLVLAVWWQTTPTAADATLSILSNSTSGTLGTLLGAWTFSDLFVGYNEGTAYPAPLSPFSVSGVSLTQGDTYWLEVSTPDIASPNNLSWEFSYSPSVNGRMLNGTHYTSGLALPYFQLLSQPVPEPSSLALLMPGVLLFGLCRRPRRCCVHNVTTGRNGRRC